MGRTRNKDEELRHRIAKWIRFMHRQNGGPFKTASQLARAMGSPQSDVSFYGNERPGRGPGLDFFNRFRKVVHAHAGYSADMILDSDPPIGASMQSEVPQKKSA